jgi:glutathione synthase/RimK-type ligase-like ATP-grasp enzyme
VGRERSFPDALIAAINTRGKTDGVHAEYAQINITRSEDSCPYDVLLDRISHEVPVYQAYLKHAALNGTRVVNNPFWRIADDKFFNTTLAAKLGVAVPKTRLIPSKSYGKDITSQSLRNLAFPLGWERVFVELGFPLYLKPHWGGGWRDVFRITSRDEFFAAYERTGEKAMIAQEGIKWTQYVRCIVIGGTQVLPAAWDPRLGHFERYTGAQQSMPPLSAEMTARVTQDAIKLCRALKYDMNTVEFAIADNVAYAIDFMNSAPDFDRTSLGEEHFDWTVAALANLLIQKCHEPAANPQDIAQLF